MATFQAMTVRSLSMIYLALFASIALASFFVMRTFSDKIQGFFFRDHFQKQGFLDRLLSETDRFVNMHVYGASPFFDTVLPLLLSLWSAQFVAGLIVTMLIRRNPIAQVNGG